MSSTTVFASSVTCSGVRSSARRAQRSGRACAPAAAALPESATPLAAGAGGRESVQLASKFGFEGVEEGLFGFKPFPELWVGRLAMMGFAMGAGNELLTGVPTLEQIGIMTPNSDLFAVLSVAIGGATLAATARTLVSLQSGDMSVRDFRRYAQFFGLDAERIAEAEARKRTLADSVFAASAADATSSMESASSAATEVPYVRKSAEQLELEYAKDVEMRNGRWAMLGFASLILIEAATGNGLVGQLETYAKFVGLLGANSGF